MIHNISIIVFRSRASRIVHAALKNGSIESDGIPEEVSELDEDQRVSNNCENITDIMYNNEQKTLRTTGDLDFLTHPSIDLWNTPIILSPLQEIAQENVYNQAITLNDSTADTSFENYEADISESGVISVNFLNNGKNLQNKTLTFSVVSDVELSLEDRSDEKLDTREHLEFPNDKKKLSNGTVTDIENLRETESLNINQLIDSNIAQEDNDSDYIVEDSHSESSDSEKEVNKIGDERFIKLVDYSESENSEDNSMQKENLEAEKCKRTRRKRQDVSIDDWNSRKQRTDREKGRPYKGRKKEEGKWKYTVPKNERILEPRCDCCLMNTKSRIDCGLISDADRQQIFDYFWNLTWKEKKMYSNMLIKMKSTKRTRDRKEENKSRRSYSLEYHLKINENKIRVCKEMFHRTLGIRPWSSLNWKKKKEQIL